MAWNESTSPSVIVMLTQTHESGREKCFLYYPKSLAYPSVKLNAEDEFQDGFTHTLKLASLDENEETRAQVRELDMTTEDESETKKFWHLLFAGWPDFLVPEGADREALLNLIRLSRQKNGDNTNNPRIIHCSAGVGRTGSFIALDWLMQELEEGSLDNVPDDEDPIFQVVESLRRQRMMMVQGEAQFSFLYDVIREQWRERYTELHPEEAERLGIPAVTEHKAKKAKKSRGSEVSQPEGDEDERAELEAELMDAQLEFDKGKT